MLSLRCVASSGNIYQKHRLTLVTSFNSASQHSCLLSIVTSFNSAGEHSWLLSVVTSSCSYICLSLRACSVSCNNRWNKLLFIVPKYFLGRGFLSVSMYTQSNKNPSAWNFLSPELEVTWRTVDTIIWVVLLSPYLRIRGVSPSSIRYNQSRRVYINRKQQYICLISN